jgi:hypothetical protein
MGSFFSKPNTGPQISNQYLRKQTQKPKTGPQISNQYLRKQKQKQMQK